VLITRKSVSAVVAACALAFAGCALIPLHEKAVAISIIGQTKGSRFVKDLALRIAGSQPQETARIRAIGSALFSAGVPIGTLDVAPTTAADVDLGALRKAEPFDPAFLRAMIAIHEATIALCKAEIAKGDQVDLKTTSQAMIDSETSQLASMRRRLKS